MTLAEQNARHDALVDAVRAAVAAIGEERPTEQGLRIVEALKALKDEVPRVTHTEPVDYLKAVQVAAENSRSGAATVETPIGDLSCRRRRVTWKDGRTAWSSVYFLDGEPTTLKAIKKAGLARRPTTRNRKQRIET